MTAMVVVGGGGLGAEVREAIDLASGLDFLGFLDDAEVPDRIGPVTASSIPTGATAILAIGDPVARMTLSRQLHDVRFGAVVHPTAVVSPRAELHPGAFVGALSFVGPRAVIGEHVAINVSCCIAHDVRVDPFAVLSPLSNVNGNARIGCGVLLGSSTVVSVGVSVGDWSKVATGACVMRSHGPGHLLTGNPATGRVLFRDPSPG